MQESPSHLPCKLKTKKIKKTKTIILLLLRITFTEKRGFETPQNFNITIF